MEDNNTFGYPVKKRGLGRGLGALIPSSETGLSDKRPYITVGIEEIRPNPFQPRKNIKESAIEQLAESIKERGIIQPLLVRRVGDGYEIIAGERRWRAAQKAGLMEIPVLVREADPPDRLELALIENIQRENLNPIEEAEAYYKLTNEFNLSQEEIGRKVGKDRSTVANLLRLLKLPPQIQKKIADGSLSLGHAKCLLGLDSGQDQIRLAELVLEKGLSVRGLENVIGKTKLIKKRGRKEEKADQTEDDYWLKGLLQRYQTKIKLKRKKKGGVLEIHFYSEEDLIRIVDLLMPNGSI